MNSALPKNTEEVKRRISDFKRNELRKIFYDIAKDYREKYVESNKDQYLVDAIKIMLLGWNWRAYAGTNISNEEFDNQINKFLNSNRSLLEYLENSEKTLKDIDFQYKLNNETLENQIINCFNSILEYQSIGSTGASKALHMFYPKVFMMWDKEIITQYHKDREKHFRKHKKGEGKCYVTFLQETQEFIKGKSNIEKLKGKNPVKIMDEYNYAEYSLVT